MRYELNSNEVSSEVIDGEVIAINLTSGSYYSLRGSSDVVWALVLAGWTADEIAGRVAGETNQPRALVIESITGFIDYLRAENLVVPSTRVAGGEAPGLRQITQFLPPTAEKFTDMQELLLVDPIHEVTEAGWPQRRS